MKLTWLGHSSFRLEIEDQVLLIDPWFTGNPVFPEGQRDAAIAGATRILVTHGHGDHAADAGPLAKELGIEFVAMFDLAQTINAIFGTECLGMHKGGTVQIGNVAVTMVHATHSSSFEHDGVQHYTGAAAGFMIEGEGRTIYVSGDTDVHADMGILADLHAPDIGILCCGGHFTMDMKRAAYAAKTFFNFKTVIPCHYKTFPLLAQTADELIAALPGIDVKTPDVMETIEL